MICNPESCLWCRYLKCVSEGVCGEMEYHCVLPYYYKCSNRIEYGTTSTNPYTQKNTRVRMS